MDSSLLSSIPSLQNNDPNFASFMAQLELQKKLMSIQAIRGLQDYLKQIISYSIIQERIKEQLSDLPLNLRHDSSSTVASSPMPSAASIPQVQYDLTEQNRIKSTLHKLLEQSYLQNTNSTERTTSLSEKSHDSSLNAESSSEKPKASSVSLEQRLREVILKEAQKKVSRSKHISKQQDIAVAMSKSDFVKHAQTKKPSHTEQMNVLRKSWKCGHDAHFAKGYCQQCFLKTANRKNSRKTDDQFPLIYQQLRERVKQIVKKEDNMDLEPQKPETATIQVKTEVKVEESQ